MLDFKSAPKTQIWYRGPSSEHFWQVWLISVQRFQRRRFKCEKLTDGRTDGRRTLTHDKSSHDIWPGELKNTLEGLQGLWTGGAGAGIFVRTEFFFGKNQGKKLKKKSLPPPLQ